MCRTRSGPASREQRSSSSRGCNNPEEAATADVIQTEQQKRQAGSFVWWGYATAQPGASDASARVLVFTVKGRERGAGAKLWWALGATGGAARCTATGETPDKLLSDFLSCPSLSQAVQVVVDWAHHLLHRHDCQLCVLCVCGAVAAGSSG